MEGISAVTARISEIRALMQAPVVAPTRSSPAVAAASAAPAPGTFAEVLSRAVGAPTPAAATPVPAPAAAGPSGGLPVAELKARYRNGRVPAEVLTPLGHGDHRLAAPAAEAFTRMEAAARRDGVALGVTDSYRSYEAQVDVARRKGLYSAGGLAAQPGTSAHGWGLAVDLDLDAAAQSWMRTHGARFGFVEDTPREPWHWAWSD